MKTALTLIAVIGSVAGTASAEKYMDPNAPVISRQTLDLSSRTVTCFDVVQQPGGTTVSYTFVVDADCCDWSISACGSDRVDTIFNLFGPGGDSVAGNDDGHCSYPCQYGPSEIGTSWGDSCLVAGTYVLEIGLFSWAGFDANCDFLNAPVDYTVCVDICDGGTAGTIDQPGAFTLGDAFPNPFNPATTINFSLAETANASLRVFNVAGAEVASLVNGLTAAGEHSVTFDASNLTSGVYFYTLEVAGLVETRKMILVK